MKRRLFVAAGVAAALAGVAACGSSDDGDKKDSQSQAPGASSNAPAPGNGKKVTVWLMKGTAPDDYLAAFKTKFEADHPGATLDVQIQQWNGIDQKIISALASKDAPDVMEAGNTQVATYAASGGVKDLTGKVNELGGKDWLSGLSLPGKVDGKQYGVPFYAANRVVIYNKEAFAAAGITAPPKTQPETVAAANGKIAQFVAVPGELETVVKANPALKDKYGFFPIPGKDASKPGAVLTGGSDLIIPETAKNQDLAYDVIKQFNSDEWQSKLAKAIKMLPNKTTLSTALEGDPGAAAMMTGATNGFATPGSPNWTAVESNNPIKAYLTKVLTGTDAAAAGKEANDTLTKTLNTKS